jgi:hypothetical protein
MYSYRRMPCYCVISRRIYDCYYSSMSIRDMFCLLGPSSHAELSYHSSVEGLAGANATCIHWWLRLGRSRLRVGVWLRLRSWFRRWVWLWGRLRIRLCWVGLRLRLRVRLWVCFVGPNIMYHWLRLGWSWLRVGVWLWLGSWLGGWFRIRLCWGGLGLRLWLGLWVCLVGTNILYYWLRFGWSWLRVGVWLRLRRWLGIRL